MTIQPNSPLFLCLLKIVCWKALRRANDAQTNEPKQKQKRSVAYTMLDKLVEVASWMWFTCMCVRACRYVCIHVRFFMSVEGVQMNCDQKFLLLHSACGWKNTTEIVKKKRHKKKKRKKRKKRKKKWLRNLFSANNLLIMNANTSWEPLFQLEIFSVIWIWSQCTFKGR